jgi:hypothetical protein
MIKNKNQCSNCKYWISLCDEKKISEHNDCETCNVHTNWRDYNKNCDIVDYADWVGKCRRYPPKIKNDYISIAGCKFHKNISHNAIAFPNENVPIKDADFLELDISEEIMEHSFPYTNNDTWCGEFSLK